MRPVLCLFLGSALLASAGFAADKPASKSKQNQGMNEDVRRAIEFQRAKDRADARQLRLEAKHPTVFYNQAERNADRDSMPGNKVTDPGPRVKK